MQNRWNTEEARTLNQDPLKLRVYTSRLLGQEEDLVLHGGGNTSVKTKQTNIFGETEDIIFVKGSGWNLGTIEPEGFAPVKLKELLKLAELTTLSDTEMVKYQRMAMTDPAAPNPSVEAILHALIPFDFVDHTHADAVVTISNSPKGEQLLRSIYEEDILIVPYIMPGFILAKQIYDLTKNIDWNSIRGIILLHHGVFTFHNDPKVSYDNMIEIVSRAENYLQTHAPLTHKNVDQKPVNPLEIAKIRKQVSDIQNKPILAQLDTQKETLAFTHLPNVSEITQRGPLTPDHIIRTKRTPVILSKNPEKELVKYAQNYKKEFDSFNEGSLTCLDRAPRWAIWPQYGTLVFGDSVKNMHIIRDISRHTMKAIAQAEQLGGWKALSKKDLFEMEYWVLEQNKLKKAGQTKPMQGKIALVTGAASGIGKACVQELIDKGAVVAALDISKDIHSLPKRPEILPLQCDLTDPTQVDSAIHQVISLFGGLDLLVSNAGVFPKSYSIKEMDETIWAKSMDVNLSSHLVLLKKCSPFLALGMDPAVVIVASKNVPAPGPGAAAYSVAKAGLTQLGRIAALEMGKEGIRINMVHPNAVYDTGIWTEEILQARAQHYGLSVEEYKTNNVLKSEVTSSDVAQLIVTVLGSSFTKTTGAQIPIDGGNDRVI